jgi:hypothetical protein
MVARGNLCDFFGLLRRADVSFFQAKYQPPRATATNSAAEDRADISNCCFLPCWASLVRRGTNGFRKRWQSYVGLSRIEPFHDTIRLGSLRQVKSFEFLNASAADRLRGTRLEIRGRRRDNTPRARWCGRPRSLRLRFLEKLVETQYDSPKNSFSKILLFPEILIGPIRIGKDLVDPATQRVLDQSPLRLLGPIESFALLDQLLERGT